MDNRNIAIGGLDCGNASYHYRFTCSVCHSQLTEIILYVKEDRELYLKCKHGHECIKKEVTENYYKKVKLCMDNNVYQPKEVKPNSSQH